jgi:6-phosphogluconolactonase
MRWAKFRMFLVLMGAVIGMPACGSFFSSCHMCPPVPKPMHFVYTANAAGNPSTVSALSTSPSTGALSPIGGSPYGTGLGSMALAADTTNHRVYIANSQSGDISAFNLDPTTGALSKVLGSPFGSEAGVDALAVSPDGAFVYAVSGSSANLWAFSINSDGGLVALGSPIVIAPGSVQSSAVVMDPTGTYLYTLSGDSSSASAYGFSRNTTTGALTPLSGPPPAIAGVSNRGVFDRTGNFLLLTGNNEFGTNGGIEVFGLNSSTGVLTLVSGPVQIGDDQSGITVDSSNKYVYVANTADVTISAFQFDSSTGALSGVMGSPFPSGGNGNINGPLGITTSSTGSFVYVCNASNDISVFSITSATGALSAIAGSPFPDGGNGPSAIVFVP